MKLKHTILNGEIILASLLNLVELFFLKIAKIESKYKSNTLWESFYDCLQNMKLHNFHITNSNGMNQTFPCRNKYNL